MPGTQLDFAGELDRSSLNSLMPIAYKLARPELYIKGFPASMANFAPGACSNNSCGLGPLPLY